MCSCRLRGLEAVESVTEQETRMQPPLRSPVRSELEANHPEMNDFRLWEETTGPGENPQTTQRP